MHRFCFVLLGLLATLPSFAKSSQSVTVYNDNLALVRDVRELNYQKGTGEILFEEVSGQIDATSVHFKAPGVAMHEQNFDYDLVSSDKLIQKYIDQQIEIISENGDLASGTLLTATSSSRYGTGYIILKSSDGSLRNFLLSSITEIRYPELPEGLITRPTLRWLVQSDKTEAKETEVSYLTSGLGWRADYVLVQPVENKGPSELSAWVTINNNCGTSFKNAKLKLVAGEVNRAETRGGRPQAAYKIMAMDAAAPGFTGKSFFEYHLYTLQRPTDLLNEQTKQVSLFPVTTVSTNRIYAYDWRRDNDNVGVLLEFMNTKTNGLGMALPAGRFRIYQEDDDGSEEFIGEDNIEHTPVKEKVRVRVGKAFDIAVERVEKDRRRISGRVTEVDIEVKLRNHKKEAVEVVVMDYFRGDWDVIRSSLNWRKESSRLLEFDVIARPDEEAVLTYTVRTR